MQGRLIENGKLTAVIKDANLIGNGPAVLESIDLVGNDSRMLPGGGSCGKDGQMVPVGFGLPTVRAQAITVGGRNA
jgi:TldD protein